MISCTDWTLGAILIMSSLGVVLAKKPVHAGLSFLAALLTLSASYLQLNAEFIAVMQILVYAGAIMVIFMFVIILFQDAYQHIEHTAAKSPRSLLYLSLALIILALLLFGYTLAPVASRGAIPQNSGSVEVIGRALFIDFFFPFEAVILLFLIAVVGAVYIGRKGDADGQ